MVGALVVLSASQRNASVLLLLPFTVLAFRHEYSPISHALQSLYADCDTQYNCGDYLKSMAP